MKRPHNALKDRLNRLFEQYRLFTLLSDDSLTQQQRVFLQKMQEVVSRLPEAERAIISRRYLPAGAEYIRDGEIYRDLQISAGTYNQRRYRAFEKLAAAFGLNEPINQNEKDDEK